MIVSSERITSRQNPLVKWVCSLQDKKGREAASSFMAEGLKLTLEAAASRLEVTHIFLMESRAEQYLAQLKERFSADLYEKTLLVVLADDVFAKISTEKAPQGVISVIKYLDFFDELDIIYNVDFKFPIHHRVLALSSVRDPQNLGSVIRSAVAFGTEHILLSDDCADVYNPKTVRAAMGSLFRVRITRAKDLCSLLLALKDSGRRILAAELRDNARSLTEMELMPSDVVVVGNEGHGIDPAISEMATHSVYIPISNKTESLNAAVAAALFMWEQAKHV